MKDAFRQSMAWLHTWVGLVAGWLLFFVFVTGTAGYFQQEISRWMQPERVVTVAPAEVDRTILTDRAIERLTTVAPVAASWQITFPYRQPGDRDWQNFSVRWEEMPSGTHDYGASSNERLDPASGAVLPPDPEPRETAGGFGLYRMHYALHYLPYDWAIRIVGIATMLMLLAIVSGVITHKKIFKDFFTFRPGKGQRSWLDAHNVVSVMALPFFLMITYSGLVFFLFAYMPAGKDVIYGTDPETSGAYYDELYEGGEHRHAPIGRPAAPLAPMIAQAGKAWGMDQIAWITVERMEGEVPAVELTHVPMGLGRNDAATMRFNADTGQRLPDEPASSGAPGVTQSVLFNLHEGLYVDIWGRWAYFASGLLGCAMVGTGLVLWSVKRRRFHLNEDRGHQEQFGVRLVESLNVATIAGLPLAVAGFFWANRLLPVDMMDRAAWEYHSLFALWLGTLFYALGRPLRRAWIELLWASCAAFACVPLLNALTTGRGLPISLAEGDWVFAGFDLTMLGLAGAFAFTARKVQRRLRPVTVPARQPVLRAAQA